MKKYILLYTSMVLLGMVLAFTVRPNKVNPHDYVGEHYADFLVQNDVDLMVVNKINGKRSYEVAGYYKPQFKEIVILKKEFDWAFMHEYGHVVAHVNGDIDESKEFVEIYELEKNNNTLPNYEYAKGNSSEYFACSFKNYIEHPERMKEECPLTYWFIDNIENK